MPPYAPVEQRFWAKVSGGDYTECWQWTASLTTGGYGRFPTSSAYVAHKTAYELLIGDVPDGLQLDHLCRNRACVNPWHLEPVTQQVNLARGMGVGPAVAVTRAKTHCPNGHLYDEVNTSYVGQTRTRRCRICASEKWRRYSRGRRRSC